MLKIFAGPPFFSGLPGEKFIRQDDSPPGMISLEYGDKEFQAILRRELNLGSSASFQPRDFLRGTQLYEYCIGAIKDGEISYILVHGSFVATPVYILVKTDFAEDFRFPEVAKELEEQGLDPRKTRLVCVAVNASGTVKDAEKYPEIQIIMIPF
jgi:hypothetical protein